MHSIKLSKVEHRLTELYTDRDWIHFCYDDVRFMVVMEVSDAGIGVGAVCEDGSEINISEAGDGSAHFILSHEKLPDMPVSFMTHNGVICMGVTVDNEQWIVTDQIGSTYLYLNSSGKWDQIVTPERAVFTNYPAWISSRGEI